MSSSQLSSRSSSAHPPNRSASGIYPSSSSSLHPPSSPNNDTHKFSSKLRHMFEHQKHASFLAAVTIIEIGNVPQLSGDFEASYEFLGKAPKAKDSLLGPKQSVPDLKISTIHHAGSTTSLRSTSTGQGSPLSPIHPAAASQIAASYHSSASNPNAQASSSTSPTPAPARQPSSLRGPTKKASDPTPLRQSIRSEEVITPIASPSIDLTEEPEDYGGTAESRVHSTDYAANGNPRPPHIMLREASTSMSRTSSMGAPGGAPAARGGTITDPSVILAELPTKLPDLNRTNTNLTSRTQSSTLDTVPPPSQSRHHKERTGSSTSLNSVHNSKLKSHRRGRTPARPLKQHTCTWNYEVEHSIRININKSSTNSSRVNLLSPTNRQESSPGILGSGAKSESGLRIAIEQVLAPHRHASEDGQAGENAKKAGHGRAHFGSVYVDLAAFAGKGRLTRRFLLMGSKTNATVKLTVEMKWLGGEERWVAPPMQEGHHVTGVQDLVGQDAEENLRTDLSLAKTSSNSSSSSSALSGAAQSINPSMASSINLSRNQSSLSLANLPTPVAYISYEHHLRPVAPPIPPARQTLNPFSQAPSEGTVMNIKNKISLHRQHRHLHHSVHMRDGDHLKRHNGIADLPADIVIERIFNPTPSNEEGPFTYIPMRPPNILVRQVDDDSLSQVRQVGNRQDSGDSKEAEDESGLETPIIGREMKNGWLKGRKERRDMREREREMRARVVTA